MRQIKPPERVHMDGCPAPSDRFESYPVRRPDGQRVTVTRCLECGGQAVLNIDPTEDEDA